MQFNKLEVASLAHQPSHAFDKEGILILKERQDGFFRKSEDKGVLNLKRKVSLKELSCIHPRQQVSIARWCRLRGNLLFYFKGSDHLSEPAGVLVLENCKVVEEQNTEAPYSFVIVFEEGSQHCCAMSAADRESWIAAVSSASISHLRKKVEDLRRKTVSCQPFYISSIETYRASCGLTLDISVPPFLEMAVSCDNLLCDGNGCPPSPRAVILIQKPPSAKWLLYAQTELVEKTSNPNFLVTANFRASDGIDDTTKLCICVHNVREKMSNITTQLGKAIVTLGSVKEAVRLRVPLVSPSGKPTGFVTLAQWTLETEEAAASDMHSYQSSTPHHQPIPPPSMCCHRRTQSLPPKLCARTIHPSQGSLNLLYSNPLMCTYRFQSGLGGDISVVEVMAESKSCLRFPQQLLKLWIEEEKQLQEELLSLGDLADEFQLKQQKLINKHHRLRNKYGLARDVLQSFVDAGITHKKSEEKTEESTEFVPVNLHLQRMWAQNESLRKAAFYDIVTVGAFSANAQGFKHGGLADLLKNLSTSMTEASHKVDQMKVAIERVKRQRNKILDIIRSIIHAIREKDRETLLSTLTHLEDEVNVLLKIVDQSLVVEALKVLDGIRLLSPSCQMITLASRNYSSYAVASCLSPDPVLDAELSSGGQEGQLYGAAMAAQSHTEGASYAKDQSSDVHSIDQMEVCLMENENGNCYKPDDEHEPWDLIQFNVQASLVWLSSKIKGYCETLSALEGSSVASKGSALVRTALPSHCNSSGGVLQENARRLPNSQQISMHLKPPLAVPKTGTAESVMSSSLSPDVSPCEEDSGIGLEKSASDLDRSDGGSEDCLSFDGDKREDLPFDRINHVPMNKDDLSVDKVGISAECSVLTKEHWAVNSAVQEPLSASGDCSATGGRSVDNRTCRESPACHSVVNGHFGRPVSSGASFSISGPQGNDLPCHCSEGNSSHTTHGTVSRRVQDEPSCLTSDIPMNARNVGSLEDIKPGIQKLRHAMDGLLRTTRLVHGILRLQEPLAVSELRLAIQYRRDVCFSQALTAVVTGLLTRLWCQKQNPVFAALLFSSGPLVVLESLLTSFRDDGGRLSDMAVVVDDLSHVEFIAVPSGSLMEKSGENGYMAPGKMTTSGSATSQLDGQVVFPSIDYLQSPRVGGSRHALKVLLPVPESYFPKVRESLPKRPFEPLLSFKITPVLFSVGINEEATMAHKLECNKYERVINRASFDKLYAYYYCKYRNLNLLPDSRRRTYETPLGDLVNQLHQQVESNAAKNTEILRLASKCCRRMSGIKVTSCKSAKDRTGMSCTLEQVQILSEEFDLAETQRKRALDCMRSEGTRLVNCKKNIGVGKYAFNVLQLLTYPADYRPPAGTYGAKIT